MSGMNQELENIEPLLLWPTVVIKTMFPGNLEEMRDEAYHLNSIPNDIKKSNYGEWQSNVN